MAINDTKNLWESYNGKGFFAEAAEYSERANKDVNGNAIVDTYATKAEVTEKQDALPSSAANQFLQTNANNEITWGTLPEALDEVYIVTYGSSVSANTVSAERQAGKAVFCSKGTALLPLQAIGSNICSFNGVIGAENSTGMNGLIMAHAELMATGMWDYSTISIPKPTGTSKTLTIDTDGTVAWTATPVIPQEMTGATAQGAGASGLVPAPTAGDQAKFLKGDGTWATPPEANLANYYYDDRGNGLSAKRTGYDRPYGTTSLVGGHGNMNDYTIDATFWIDWGGIARNFFSVNTDDPGASRIGFGINSTDARAMRYLLPTPVANKYAKTDANGQITWGDVPSLPSPTINDSLLLGQADGSETWTALENDVFGTRLPDEETGKPMYDASSTDQLWTGFAGKEFGAARAYADQDGNNIKATYATKEDLNTALGDIESRLAAL